jgi:hypothetical protein
MSMLCPQCSTFYEQRLHCPTCGARLLYRDSQDRKGGRGASWRQTPWGRIFIGIVLSQGLYYGLRHLYLGVALSLQAHGAIPESAASFSHILLLQALQLIALGVGAVMAGAGQRQGFVLGCMVGVWNGVFSVLCGPSEFLSAVALYGQPLIHAAFGALAGGAGSLVWTPIPASSPLGSRVLRKQSLPHRREPLFAGPIAWWRVSLGSVIAVVGTLTAKILLDWVLDHSGGKLSTSTDLQDKIVTWEIQSLAVILGGALAGATTANGFKQGLCVGVLTGIGLACFSSTNQHSTMELIALTPVGAFCLSLVGGWFGGQLLPPVVPKIRLSHELGAMV